MRKIILVVCVILSSEIVIAKDKSALIYYGFGSHYGYKSTTDKVGYTIRDFNENSQALGFEYKNNSDWSFGALRYLDSYNCQSLALYADYNHYRTTFFTNHTFFYNSKILLTEKCFSFGEARNNSKQALITAAPSIVISIFNRLDTEISLYPTGIVGRIIGRDTVYEEILLSVIFKYRF